MNTNILKTAIAALTLLVAFNSCKKEETKFHIEVACDPERGTVTGTGDYAEGSKVTISAAGKDGYRFIGWKEYSVLTDSVVTINIVSDRTYTAIFCKADVIEKFQNGYKKTSETIDEDTIRYEAVPDENYYFWKWSNGEINPIIVTQEAISDLTPIFKPYPEGSIHAVFFVSETKRVIFSKGNLQFNPTLGTHTRADGTTAPGTWRFAENQYDVIYGDSIVSATYDGWIDSFAWGTSGWSGSGATYYQPYDGVMGSDGDTTATQYGPKGNYDLTGDYAYADWGVYNPISNGGNKPGMWRTLNYDEFYYFAYKKHLAGYFYDGFPWGFFFSQNREEKNIYDEDMGSEDEKYKQATVSKYSDMVFLRWCSAFGCYWTTTSSNNEKERYAKPLSVDYLYKSWYTSWIYSRSCRFPVRLVMDVEE